MDHKDLWLEIIKELSKEVQRANLITWFRNTSVLSLEKGVMVVGLPLPMFLNWHQEHYAKQTLEAAKKIMPEIQGLAYEIDIALGDKDPRVVDLGQHFPEKESRKVPNKAEVRINGELVSKALNPNYSLENFVVAPENRLAHAACMNVARYPGKNYNPLFVYGGVGLGKTHLIQATGSEILKNDPKKVVVYITSEMFTNELIESIQSKNMNKFRNKYRKVNCLIIDDIQFIANKERTQEEFFHTFNTLADSGNQVIITSDRPPKELTLLNERLVSRFESGMTVDVKMPDYETRIAILKNRCQQAQVFVNDQVLEFIAFNIDTSVRALVGVLNQVIARYELENTAPTVRSVSEILKQTKKEVKMMGYVQNDPTPHRAVTLDRLTDLVSEYYSLPKSEVLSESRARECLIPRQIIMYLAKSKLHMPLVKIGEGMGNRNHTTVMHSITKMEIQLKNDRQLLCDVNAIAKEAGIH
jgi:chromosomal replication initiator protein